MKYYKIVHLTTLLLFAFLAVFSQTSKTIDSLETQYQTCLDKGENMLGCSKVFYAEMDSMLNITYVKLRSNMDTLSKAALKKEQKAWLVKRDAYFKKTLKDFRDENPTVSPYGSAVGAKDDAMFMYDYNAQFVKARILALIEELTKKQHIK